MLYPKPSSGNNLRNLSPKKNTPQKKKKRKISLIYWFTILALSSWMVYLNIHVVFEYQGASAKYETVLREYEAKKKELEEKMEEYLRLRARMEEHGLQ